MSKKLPYNLTKEEIKDLRKKKEEIYKYVMKQFEEETNKKSGIPHIFKMTLDGGWAKYQYDLNLTENWCMHDIQKKIETLLKRYGGTISCGELCGAGYLENEKKKN